MPAKTTSSSRRVSPKASRPYMPGYGLPTGHKGLLAWSWAKQRLQRSHNYWFTSSKPDGAPHTMVVWGLWLDDTFVFSTGSRSRKTRNLASNPHCVVCTEHAHEAVIVEGTAELADLPLRRRFLKQYVRKYDYDMSAMAPEILALKEPVFTVRPHVVFGLEEKRFADKATKWEF
jgi:hypothetical protein